MKALIISLLLTGFIMGQEVVDPRMAPEAISMCYLHCVLKGLNRAPRIGSYSSYTSKKLMVDAVDFMIAPDGCYGVAHSACHNAGIPVIVVKENKTVLNVIPEVHREDLIFVENYWEAVGVVMAMKAGVLPASMRRPLRSTLVK